MAKSKMEYIQEFKEMANKCNRIVIYGAGIYGKLMLKKLHEWNIYKKTEFAVTGTPKETEVMGVDVCSIEACAAASEDVLVIVAVGIALTPEMVSRLKELGVKNYIVLTNELRTELKEGAEGAANISNRMFEQQQELLREIYQNIYHLTERMERLENAYVQQVENKLKLDALYDMMKGNA